MFTVRTMSGTTYTVRNGRMTRMGDPIRNTDVDITEAVFTNVRPPRVGEPWQFRLAGFRNNPVTTTPIVSVLTAIEPMPAAWVASLDRPLDSVQAVFSHVDGDEDAYCPAHDLYNCPFVR